MRKQMLGWPAPRQAPRPQPAAATHNSAATPIMPSLPAPSRKDGKPLTDKSLYTLFWKAAFRVTGKRTNPHLVGGGRALTPAADDADSRRRNPVLGPVPAQAVALRPACLARPCAHSHPCPRPCTLPGGKPTSCRPPVLPPPQVRDMIVTHLRGSGASERELEVRAARAVLPLSHQLRLHHPVKMSAAGGLANLPMLGPAHLLPPPPRRASPPRLWQFTWATASRCSATRTTGAPRSKRWAGRGCAMRALCGQGPMLSDSSRHTLC